jgi:uncharacterized protein YndB with AHSA1/START domain
MNRDLRFEEHYPYPPERVWEAVTDSAAIADWLMPNDFQPRIGHRFTFRTEPRPGFDGVVHCEVIALEPPRRLAYTWKGGPIDTIVTITLEREPEGTKLVLEHSGFRGARAVMVSFMMSGGWGGKILPRRLREVLERRAATAPAS